MFGHFHLNNMNIDYLRKFENYGHFREACRKTGTENINVFLSINYDLFSNNIG